MFQLDPADNLTVLHKFTASPDGRSPLAGVTKDGNATCMAPPVAEGSPYSGRCYRMNQDLQESILFSFLDAPPADGNGPYYGGLFRDTDGSLYGTTSAGGDLSKCNNGGCGEIFELDLTGQLTILYRFEGGPNDGEFPTGRLVRDANGNFYGTTILAALLVLAPCISLTLPAPKPCCTPSPELRTVAGP